MSETSVEVGNSKDVAAECFGTKVPMSRFLHEKRIERINKGRYEGEEIKGSLAVVQQGDTVLEIGIGLGVVGGVIATNCAPAAVHAYEANPELIDTINDLYVLNGIEDRISVHNQVLLTGDDRPDTIPFYLHNSFLGSSLVGEDNEKRRRVDVPTRDFDTTASEIGANVLVMDIEGGELDLLRGADLSRFRAVVVEFHPKVYGVEGMQECKKILTGAGFVKQEDVSTRTVWTCVRDAG
ncbi:FkbM family methyltransferase [Aliiroseovarius crassostreae]|uniref:FkbM family methyltransferase n=1 Tax=Aliiroseovarius crassostreae TaxID=154981 RepID=UPI0021B05E5B|nr:FkbM family methyltransferase [Aliiroseovarius crassostreae]UWQ08846.1 FkbM family methyltransferase [Aliiroseovarius crassostreae]